MRWIVSSYPHIANLFIMLPLDSGADRIFGKKDDSAGNVYIADPSNNKILEWVAASQSVVALSSSGLMKPDGVAVDATGNVYIADASDNTLKERLAASGNLITLITGLNIPYGVAVDGAGNVYATDAGNGVVKEWVATNNSVVTVISGLSGPLGVAVDGNGNLYVADSTNNVVDELPRAFVDPTAKVETGNAGSDTLPVVLPSTENLLPPFEPASSQSWLTITGVAGDVVGFSFTGTVSTRTANISLLGQNIAVTQNVPVIVGTSVRLTGIQMANGSFHFTFTNTPGATFTVLSTTNVALPLNQWTPLGAPVEGPPGQFQFTDTAPTNAAQFYILVSP